MGLPLRPECNIKDRGIRLNTETNPRTLILNYIHQADKPVRTKQLINYLFDTMYGPDEETHLQTRKDAWQALDSLKEEGYIAELGGSWFLTPSGMELMGWLV